MFHEMKSLLSEKVFRDIINFFPIPISLTESSAYLECFIEIDNNLGGMAGQEDNHYRHQEPGHCVISPRNKRK